MRDASSAVPLRSGSSIENRAPPPGASEIVLRLVAGTACDGPAGDVVEWHYTVDLGRDLGAAQ